MSCRNQLRPMQRGFTLVELMITIIITGVFAASLYAFFNSGLSSYLGLQKTASNFTELAEQSQRIAKVVRGATDLISAQDESLEAYAYFYPTDTYVSRLRYYLDASGTKLMADVTPMSANPPVGTELTAQKKTYTIMNAYKRQTGIKLFQYLTTGNTALSLPIGDLHTVKTIRINLAAQTSGPSGSQAVTVEVNLRNRKTNL